MTRWNVCVLAVVAVMGGGTIGWGQEAKPAAAPELAVTRTYNVSDLVRGADDYPFDSAIIPPTMDPASRVTKTEGAVRRGLFDVSREERAKGGIGLEQLQLVIMRTVEPESWRPVMVPGQATMERTPEMVGSVQPLGGLLIVTQTERNQKRVQELLDSIRREYGPLKTVRVNLRWVVLEPGQAKALVGAGAVDEGALAKLPAEATWAAGRTACFSGQTVYVASGRGRTWAYHLAPVVGTNAVAYDAETQLVQSGAVAQVTPLLSPDGQTAVLDVASVATDWSPMEKQVQVGGGVVGETGGAATRPTEQFVDRLNVGVQQMRTTVRVPVGRMMVVGGMTKEPGVDGREMYLLAEVTAE